jgi:hypothetical protein
VPERLVSQSTGEVVGAPVLFARSPFERARGLLGRELPDGAALALERARQVHTFGMAYALDVVFCDEQWIVLHAVHDMRPARITRWVRRARVAVEIPSHARRARVRRGDALRLERY